MGIPNKDEIKGKAKPAAGKAKEKAAEAGKRLKR
jgi:uncharacterized protein YjbJ (UPF0337 family)